MGGGKMGKIEKGIGSNMVFANQRIDGKCKETGVCKG